MRKTCLQKDPSCSQTLGPAQVPVTWKWGSPANLGYEEEVSLESPFSSLASALPEAGTLQPDTMQQITISVSAQQAKQFAHRPASEPLKEVKL